MDPSDHAISEEGKGEPLHITDMSENNSQGMTAMAKASSPAQNPPEDPENLNTNLDTTVKDRCSVSVPDTVNIQTQPKGMPSETALVGLNGTNSADIVSPCENKTSSTSTDSSFGVTLPSKNDTHQVGQLEAKEPKICDSVGEPCSSANNRDVETIPELNMKSEVIDIQTIAEVSSCDAERMDSEQTDTQQKETLGMIGSSPAEGSTPLANIKQEVQEETKLMDYRDEENNDDGDADESSISSSDSSILVISSEDEGEEEETKQSTSQNKKTKKKSEIKDMFGMDLYTKGERTLADLPPIEELKITVDDTVVMKELGTVSSVIGPLVIVQSKKLVPALNVDSIVFSEDRKPLGQVFETFGPVPSPLYSIRFNSPAEIEERGVKVGVAVFYAPDMADFTHFVFLEQLRRMRGSDASWEHNNEPPAKYLDYSDDEEERRARAKLKGHPLPENENDTESMAGRKRKRKPRNQQNQQNGVDDSTAKPEGAMQQSQWMEGSWRGSPLTQWPPPSGNPGFHPSQGPPQRQWGSQPSPRPRGPPGRQPHMWQDNHNGEYFQSQGPPSYNPFRGSRPFGPPGPSGPPGPPRAPGPPPGPRHHWGRELQDIGPRHSRPLPAHGAPSPRSNLPMDMRFVQNVDMHENTGIRPEGPPNAHGAGGQYVPPPAQFGGAPSFAHGPGRWY